MSTCEVRECGLSMVIVLMCIFTSVVWDNLQCYNMKVSERGSEKVPFYALPYLRFEAHTVERWNGSCIVGQMQGMAKQQIKKASPSSSLIVMPQTMSTPLIDSHLFVYSFSSILPFLPHVPLCCINWLASTGGVISLSFSLHPSSFRNRTPALRHVI